MLVPYYFKDTNLYVFLQRRSDDAPRNPGRLGAFGGGLEADENNEEALLREIMEELEYTPEHYVLLGAFETNHSVSNYYIEEVGENFANQVVVHEGKRGEWHQALNVIKRDDISPNTRRVVNAMIVNLI